MNHFFKHIILNPSFAVCFAIFGIFSANSQTLDWSYDYMGAETSMAIGISDEALDQITITDGTFPIGSPIGVFYQNNSGEYVCAGSIIWDAQSNVIPVWGGGPDGIAIEQEFTLFAFVNGATYIADSPSMDSNLYVPYSFISLLTFFKITIFRGIRESV